MIKYFCVLLAFIWNSHFGISQSDFFKSPTFSISIFNHSIGIPFKDYFKTPMNFGVAIGAEFGYGGKRAGKQFQLLQLGWYHHKNLNTALWIKTDLIRRFQSKNGAFVDVQGGLGYIRDFSAYQSFQKGEDGNYQEQSGNSKGGLLVSLGAGIGYQFEIEDKYLLSPFVRYEGMLQLPYAKLLPFFPHSQMHIGTKFKLTK